MSMDSFESLDDITERFASYEARNARLDAEEAAAKAADEATCDVLVAVRCPRMGGMGAHMGQHGATSRAQRLLVCPLDGTEYIDHCGPCAAAS